MRAVVFEAPLQARLAELPEPEPASGQVRVRTRLAGVCGSDMHAYLGSQPFFVYPQIPGHEVVGEVVSDGEAQSLKPGQRVVLDPTINCGHCRPCQLGRYNCCSNIQVIGVHAPGVMAEFFVAPEQRLHPVPDSIPDEIAVMAEPLSIGLHAVNRAELHARDRIAIVGAGPIGLSILLMAELRGARCAVSDIKPTRLALAERLGAELTIDANEVDALQVIEDWTEGEGVAVAFEAVGSPSTIRAAVDMAASAGRVVILGLCHQEVCLPGVMFVRKELEVIGSRLHQHTVQEVVSLLGAERMNPRPLLSDLRPLEAFQSALDDLRERGDEFIKIVLQL
ncbi:MAG: zinc-dependent alcohol dehydrogenase [Candidatus Zipacnadales bacterium]